MVRCCDSCVSGWSMSCGTYLAAVSMMFCLWSHPLFVLVGEASVCDPGGSRWSVQRILSAQSFVVSPWRDVETCGRCALRGTKHSFALLRSHVSLALCLVRAAFVTGRHSAAQHSVLCLLLSVHPRCVATRLGLVDHCSPLEKKSRCY